jgi:hypothetical protein
MLFFHFLGDMVFQSEWMCREKYKSFFWMFAHSVLWTGCIYAGFLFNGIEIGLLSVLFLAIAHGAMDMTEHPHFKGVDLDFWFHALQIVLVYIKEI